LFSTPLELTGQGLTVQRLKLSRINKHAIDYSYNFDKLKHYPIMSEITILKTLETAAAILELRSDGILQINVRPNTTLQLKDGQEMVKAFAEIGEGNKFPLLFIAGDFALATSEARYYASGKEANQYTLASVFVVRNIAQKLMGNAYITFNKPITPTRILTSEEEAIKWLKTFL
jgi:hypothetical protein